MSDVKLERETPFSNYKINSLFMIEYCPINEMPHELFPFQKVCLDNAN